MPVLPSAAGLPIVLTTQTCARAAIEAAMAAIQALDVAAEPPYLMPVEANARAFLRGLLLGAPSYVILHDCRAMAAIACDGYKSRRASDEGALEVIWRPLARISDHVWVVSAGRLFRPIGRWRGGHGLWGHILKRAACLRHAAGPGLSDDPCGGMLHYRRFRLFTFEPQERGLAAVFPASAGRHSGGGSLAPICLPALTPPSSKPLSSPILGVLGRVHDVARAFAG